MIHGDSALHMANQNAGSLLAHSYASLFHRGQHGVARGGTHTIRKATDTDILGHTQSHALHGIEDAYRRIVVHSEEGIGIDVTIKHRWRQHLGIRTVITDTCQLLVERQTMLQQGILIAIKTVLGNLKVQLRSEIGNAPATGVNEVCYGVEGAHIVVYHHPTGIHARTYSIIEHQRHACIYQALEMLIALGVLGLRDDDPTDLVLEERLTEAHLVFIALTTLGHHDTIAMGLSLFLNTFENRHEIIVHQLGHNHTDKLLGLHLGVAQRLCQHIGREVMVAGILLNLLSQFLGNARRVLQCPRHGSHRDTHLGCNILHCQ